MSMTLLQLTNKVLIRLREDQVTTITETDYSTLIAEFCRQAIREVENAHDWNALRNTITVTTAASTYAYTLTGAGDSYNILDVFEDTTDYVLKRAPSYAWMNHQLLANSPSSGVPQYFDFNGQSSGDPVVNLYPIPDGVYSVNFNLVIKTDVTSNTAETPVPWLPVVLRARALAIEERGDDRGEILALALKQAQDALSAAVAFDSGNRPEETIWFEE